MMWVKPRPALQSSALAAKTASWTIISFTFDHSHQLQVASAHSYTNTTPPTQWQQGRRSITRDPHPHTRRALSAYDQPSFRQKQCHCSSRQCRRALTGLGCGQCAQFIVGRSFSSSHCYYLHSRQAGPCKTLSPLHALLHKCQLASWAMQVGK